MITSLFDIDECADDPPSEGRAVQAALSLCDR
jgi:hypothetical protein